MYFITKKEGCPLDFASSTPAATIWIIYGVVTNRSAGGALGKCPAKDPVDKKSDCGANSKSGGCEIHKSSSNGT